MRGINKKIISLFLAFTIVLTTFGLSSNTSYAASIKLNKTNITLLRKQTSQLKVKNKYETPYVLWSNKRLLKNPKNTKMCYLPTLLLENANISENAWFDNLKELKNTKSNLSKNELYKSWCYYQLKK